MAFLKHLFAVSVLLAINSAYCEEIDIPADCIDTDYCTTKPQVYDKYQERIDNAMEVATKHIPSFTDVLSGCISGDRSDLATDQNCPSISKEITPYILKTNTTNKLIVQSSVYQQRFTTVSCTNYLTGSAGDGSKCLTKVIGAKTDTFDASCQTVQGHISLYVYDINEGELQRVDAHIPVCCSCAVTTLENLNK